MIAHFMYYILIHDMFDNITCISKVNLNIIKLSEDILNVQVEICNELSDKTMDNRNNTLSLFNHLSIIIIKNPI